MTKAVNNSISEEVLDKLLLMFWDKGYFNTSIDDLIQSSSFNRSTLYKHFGNKQTLFVAMLKRYREKVTPKFTAPLRQETDPYIAFETFFNQFTCLTEKPGPAGCFLIATASEAPSHQSEVKQHVQEFSQYLQRLFLNQLSKNSDDYSERDKQMAHFLVANVFGLMTLLRMKDNHSIVHDQISIILTTLKNYLTHRENQI